MLDPIDQLLSRQEVNDPAPRDVTATAAPQVPAPRTIGPASATRATAKPVGGVLGKLLSIGNSMDNTIRSRMQTGPTSGDALNAVLFAMPELRAARAVEPAVADAQAIRNMMETGFAGGKTSAMVELPVSGAGRSGSTATAMKQALTTTAPADFRSMVQREIARRGGATAPEVEMAATEEVARRLASGIR